MVFRGGRIDPDSQPTEVGVSDDDAGDADRRQLDAILDAHGADAVLLRASGAHTRGGERLFFAHVVDAKGRAVPDTAGGSAGHWLHYPAGTEAPREGEILRLHRDEHGPHLVGRHRPWDAP